MKTVDLSERVTATYYDDEHEEWSQKTVAIFDVLDSVCDDYTVIEAAPVKHGRWKHHQYGNTAGYYECDNCGKINSYKSDYCPKCGTRMDGEEDG